MGCECGRGSGGKSPKVGANSKKLLEVLRLRRLKMKQLEQEKQAQEKEKPEK
jgi:hypothetical protein